ncbi:hypothetical protein [Halobacillus alkaliphilus]|uniref:hypothetical protein n=1 Tax=Halobacillus alkaliphilus TaxID=396056 RepID=UPI001FE1A7CA|nr:hypothetical protein [Halobacillus alkaliphilus]
MSLSHYEKDRRETDYETLRKLSDFFEDQPIIYLVDQKLLKRPAMKSMILLMK